MFTIHVDELGTGELLTVTQLAVPCTVRTVTGSYVVGAPDFFVWDTHLQFAAQEQNNEKNLGQNFSENFSENLGEKGLKMVNGPSQK